MEFMMNFGSRSDTTLQHRLVSPATVLLMLAFTTSNNALCAQSPPHPASSDQHEHMDTPRPELVFSTYWGTGSAINRTVAVDTHGNIFMAGGTSEAGWPVTTGVKHNGGTDVTVAKFSAGGKLLWSTLLGGPHEDYAYVSAVSDAGELYLSGRAGDGFPTTEGAFDRSFNGGIGRGPHEPTDAFVAKLSADGELIYSTYIGGNGDDNGRAIHLMPDGRLIVGGGNTTSTNMPTDRGTLSGPVLKARKGGLKDGWVAMLAADGGSLEFLTYFGPDDDDNPRGDETIRGLGVDNNGNIWIGGTTQGSDIPATGNAFQKIRGAASEAFVAKISSDGRELVYFSWLGGNGPDELETEGISDNDGNFYIAGSTGSDNFPTTPGAFQSSLKGGVNPGWYDKLESRITGGNSMQRSFADGWVAKISNSGNLDFSTLFGGSLEGPESLFGPAVDKQGRVYVTGRFRSPDLPMTDNAALPEHPSPDNRHSAVMAVFDADGRNLLYSSFFGGSGIDHGRHIAISPDGNTVYIVGETSSTDLPLVNPVQDRPTGAFLAGFSIAR